MSVVIQHKNDSVFEVILSEAALQHVLTYLGKQKDSKGIRFSVKKTGCSGLSYVVDYVTTAKDNDIVQNLAENYQLYIDKASYPFLKGMTIDYVKQGLNYKFVFNNPNQTGQCGCGESFTVE
ncbi:Iron-sulfur cluster assembly protein [Legionella massiliensis]|uniref:Iron-sulfur cluster assembly protein n=1 Tax=Legionella massiliensis TaxID=1034943 RepID=A0A078L0D6_9GAMM|nr:iron-sulfur cluster assembly accessory protein [Legionella massiliensis]CDZ78621.1 Iron-sulfur cluster assembly protein [Legionella massiliensis]CEE14359.1 Iron-binding protein IscA [Legionella massiliensis]